ncbi:PKD domain-containing protein [bacterium AH-315-M05]|nr:PKD domain-containing protein [bacterium AH-315-M05]
MKKFIVIFLLLTLNFKLQTLYSFSQCLTNVDFNTWTEEGDPANGDWVVGGGGSWVNQNINTPAPTFFVSPDTFINVIMEGTITPPSGDDDFIGFVFGYNEPIGNSSNYDCWLFDWKQGTQTANGYTAQEGQSLNHVQGNITAVWQYFWGHTNNPPLFDVVATNWGAGTGWVDNTTYQFTLEYTTSRVIIVIDGDTIFDIAGCFEPGRFGFYNFSQSGVTYADFNYRLKTDFTVLTPQVCAGDTGQFQFIDTSCTDVPGNLVSWDWDFGDGTFSTDTNPSHVYITPGPYAVQLIVTDYLGCQDTAIKSIVVSPQPMANYAAANVCLNQATVFADASTIANGTIIAWQWDFGDGTGTSTAQNPTYTYSIPDTFTVTLTVTSDSGCTTVVGYPVEVFPLPVAGFTTANVCLYDDAVFTDASTISSGIINSWQWDFGDGNTSNTQNPANLYNMDGPYAVSLIVTSDNSCQDTIVQPIQIYPAPNAGFSTNNVCLYDDAVFTDASSVSSGIIISWNWNFDDGNTSTTQDPTHPYLTDGTYDVSLVVITDNNCVDTVIQPLIIYPVPIAGFTTGPICLDDAAVFTDVTTINSPDNVVLWDWDFGDGLGTSTIQNPSYNYGSEGLYNVQLNATSNNSCTNNTSLTIEIYPLPMINFTSDKINGCAPLCVDFFDLTTLSGGTLNSWDWDFGDGSPDATAQNPSYCYLNNGQTSLIYDVTLTVTTNQGCQSDSTILEIEVYPVPVAIFDFSPLTGTILNPFINFIDQSISNSIALWSWDFGDGYTSTITSPTHAYADTGNYLVELLVRNPFGCLDSVIRDVVIEGDYILFVPNAFTPNDDLINDTFFPQGTGIDENSFEMYIYDRWGDKVYETYDIKKPWDGRANDGRKIAQQGVYIWVILIKDINEKRHRHVGHVTLIR